MGENGADSEIDKVIKDEEEQETEAEINKVIQEIKDEKPSLWQRLKGLFDADRWITIHPPHGNKEDKGVPLKIGEDGEIKAGAGGKVYKISPKKEQK